jgi:hypothetical protein
LSTLALLLSCVGAEQSGAPAVDSVHTGGLDTGDSRLSKGLLASHTLQTPPPPFEGEDSERSFDCEATELVQRQTTRNWMACKRGS